MTVALALFSGGLDSILSCRVMAAQGIRVQAVRFVTPFFGHGLLAQEEEYVARVRQSFGIDVVLCDVSQPYFEMLRNPAHGYGKNFNPCIDCKILLLREAKKLMGKYSASFLISGEVLGQRPMSQRQDTLRLIARESGCAGLILRPLCAQSQEPTMAEESGLVDRSQLLDFRGRSRQPQMELAARFGISGYPSPAGGCVLTEPVQGRRLAWYFDRHREIRANDIQLLLVGRQFQLPGGGWLVLGRDQPENERLAALHEERGFLLRMEERPGPVGILRYASSGEDLAAAAGLVVRFGKKVKEGPAGARVLFQSGEERRVILAEPLADQLFQGWFF